MNDLENTVLQERTFLHDLCNSMAIVQGSMHLILTKMKKNPDQLNREDVEKKLTAGLAALDKMNDMISNRRAKLKGEA